MADEAARAETADLSDILANAAVLFLLFSKTSKHRNLAVGVPGVKVLRHRDDISVFSLRACWLDPDKAEAAAREGGWAVLAGAEDKPHGLREAVILDDDGYAWVPGIAI